MEVFRLSREEFSKELSGKGSARYGGRWNSLGVELIYTASNRSLAMAEVAVHLTIATLPSDYRMVTIYIPDNLSMKILQESDLPVGWDIFPHPQVSQSVGDKFVSESKFCLLKIPSAVTKGDFNILINPAHSEFKKIKIIENEPFPFDRRIFKSS